MKRIDSNRAADAGSDSTAPPAAAWVAQRKLLAASLFLVLVLLLAACDPGSLVGAPTTSATQTASPTAAILGSAAGTPTPTGPLGTAQPAEAPASPTPANAAALAPSPTAEPSATAAAATLASPTPAASPAPASATVNAIKTVIARGNAEETQAFATHDPSVMADTATGAYYQELLQSYNDMTGGGIAAVQLDHLTWGAITLQDANTAQANTTESWTTTFADGSTMEETDPNVYSLVRQGGIWKIQDDQHPDSRTLQPAPGTPGVAPTPEASGSVTPTAPAAAIPPGSSVEQSSNWAGYTATGGTYTAITATWTVPNVTAGSGNTVAADATWVGIGGVDSTDLIQAGTQAQVQDGQVEYSAWWETLPQAAQIVPLDIAAGDSVSVSVARQADGTWQILIRDATSSQSFQKKLAYRSSLSSAEWIEESPTVGRRTLLPLDDFGTVTFTSATTLEHGRQRTIAQAGGQPITMYSSPAQGRRGRFGQPGARAGQPLAQPSALGADGASFAVTRTGAAAPVVVP